ncbi:MAG: hypothetical protein ACM3QS_04695 [Bacteroidota bacterium]
MNLTCFYCQTPFTLSMDQKIAALRKMHAENLHHYDAHCPRCGRANAISRERLEMFTPGWEEAIKEPVMVTTIIGETERSGETQSPNTEVPALVPAERGAPMMPAQPRKAAARKRHAPAAKKAARKGAAKKSAAKKATTKKKTAAKSKKTASKSRSKSSSRKTARKSR